MLKIDAERGKQVAELLHNKFHTTGIHGKKHMPEDTLPQGVGSGSLEHTLFITLTVSIDYMRDADALWEASRSTFEDLDTRFLFEPSKVNDASDDEMRIAMSKYKLAKKHNRDPKIWRVNSVTFLNKYAGSPLEFVKQCSYNAPAIIEALMSGHYDQNRKWVSDFPNLRGPKIGPLWVRMLRDNVGLDIKQMNELPIPVDVHVARATIATGVIRGKFSGSKGSLHNDVRRAWKESVVGLKTSNKPMAAMDLDESLWHLSKDGCTDRTPSGLCPHLGKCEASAFCVKGKIIVGSKVDIDT